MILTPHLAWYTREAFVRVEQDTMDGIMAILEGRVPEHLKNRGSVGIDGGGREGQRQK